MQQTGATELHPIYLFLGKCRRKWLVRPHQPQCAQLQCYLFILLISLCEYNHCKLHHMIWNIHQFCELDFTDIKFQRSLCEYNHCKLHHMIWNIHQFCKLDCSGSEISEANARTSSRIASRRNFAWFSTSFPDSSPSCSNLHHHIIASFDVSLLNCTLK